MTPTAEPTVIVQALPGDEPAHVVPDPRPDVLRVVLGEDHVSTPAPNIAAFHAVHELVGAAGERPTVGLDLAQTVEPLRAARTLLGPADGGLVIDGIRAGALHWDGLMRTSMQGRLLRGDWATGDVDDESWLARLGAARQLADTSLGLEKDLDGELHALVALLGPEVVEQYAAARVTMRGDQRRRHFGPLVGQYRRRLEMLDAALVGDRLPAQIARTGRGGAPRQIVAASSDGRSPVIITSVGSLAPAQVHLVIGEPTNGAVSLATAPSTPEPDTLRLEVSGPAQAGIAPFVAGSVAALLDELPPPPGGAEPLVTVVPLGYEHTDLTRHAAAAISVELDRHGVTAPGPTMSRPTARVLRTPASVPTGPARRSAVVTLRPGVRPGV